jgi:hypothetical protein
MTALRAAQALPVNRPRRQFCVNPAHLFDERACEVFMSTSFHCFNMPQIA